MPPRASEREQQGKSWLETYRWNCEKRVIISSQQVAIAIAISISISLSPTTTSTTDSLPKIGNRSLLASKKKKHKKETVKENLNDDDNAFRLIFIFRIQYLWCFVVHSFSIWEIVYNHGFAITIAFSLSLLSSFTFR